MVGQPGLQQQHAAVGRPPEQPGAAHQEPERLLGGPGPGRQQLLVELEERDQADGPVGATGTRWSTASVPMSTGDVGGTASVAASTAAT